MPVKDALVNGLLFGFASIYDSCFHTRVPSVDRPSPGLVSLYGRSPGTVSLIPSQPRSKEPDAFFAMVPEIEPVPISPGFSGPGILNLLLGRSGILSM